MSGAEHSNTECRILAISLKPRPSSEQGRPGMQCNNQMMGLGNIITEQSPRSYIMYFNVTYMNQTKKWILSVTLRGSLVKEV